MESHWQVPKDVHFLKCKALYIYILLETLWNLTWTPNKFNYAANVDSIPGSWQWETDCYAVVALLLLRSGAVLTASAMVSQQANIGQAAHEVAQNRPNIGFGPVWGYFSPFLLLVYHSMATDQGSKFLACPTFSLLQQWCMKILLPWSRNLRRHWGWGGVSRSSWQYFIAVEVVHKILSPTSHSCT